MGSLLSDFKISDVYDQLHGFAQRHQKEGATKAINGAQTKLREHMAYRSKTPIPADSERYEEGITRGLKQAEDILNHVATNLFEYID